MCKINLKSVNLLFLTPIFVLILTYGCVVLPNTANATDVAPKDIQRVGELHFEYLESGPEDVRAKLLDGSGASAKFKSLNCSQYDVDGRLIQVDEVFSDKEGIVRCTIASSRVETVKISDQNNACLTVRIHRKVAIPTSSAATKVVTPVVTPVAVVVTAGAAVSASIGGVAASLSFKDYILLAFNYLFSLLALKKKSKFGVVFDPATQKPVAGAIVQLYDAKTVKLISCALTDKDGRYIFLARAGSYTISVIKPGYLFPSHLIKSSTQFINSYIGQVINVSDENPAINLMIPIDPDAESNIKSGTFFRIFNSISLRYTLLMFGTGVGLFALISQPGLIGYLSAGSFLILWTIELFVLNRLVKYSKIIDNHDKKKVSLALVRVVDENGKLVETFVSDQFGRVLPKISDKSQKILIEKSGYQNGEYTINDTGLIERKNFRVNRI